MTQPLLTISILVSNNYDNVKRCLESVQPLRKAVSSELILTDTGCDKNVRQLIESYADRIIDFPWRQDFSAARNAGLKEAKGQWFLYVDDDEWFEDTTSIEQFFLTGECDNYNVAFYIQRNYVDARGDNYVDSYVDRVIRITKDLHFEHRIHEAYTGVEIGEKKILSSFVHHYGYVYKDEKEKQKKHQRNQTLLELECKEYPNDMRMRYQLVLNSLMMEDWDETIQLALDAVKMESNSEYWDACHTLVLYCLNKKADWDGIISYGKAFIKKKLYPYDSFGVLQYMMTAYGEKGEYDKVYVLGEEAINLYTEYQKDPTFFNKNQLMRTEHLEEEKIRKMMAYYSEAKKRLHITDDEGNGELVFDKHFFDGEERDGFYVEPLMKSAWAAQMEVLSKIDSICKENDITYFADWGTLLGAVRHHGFVPWDDDIDICMMREDIYRLKAVICGRDDLLWMDIYEDPNWGPHAIKVINTTEFKVNRHFIKEYHGFPFTAGLDIFTIDYVPRDKKLEEEQYDVLRTIAEACHVKDEMEEYTPMSPEHIKGTKILLHDLEKIKKMCNIEFSQENPTEQELLILMEEVAGLYGDEDSDYLTQVACLGIGMDYYISKGAYAKTIRVPFEQMEIEIPVGYEELLRKKYGDDYMTPINKAGGHEYPFYGRLVKAVAEQKGWTEEETWQYVKDISCNYFHEFLHQKAEPSILYDETYFTEDSGGDVSVTEEQKRIQAAELEVLCEIQRLCQKMGIKVYAIGNTIADAVLYQGFGPDYDGIHLAMKREDYVPFMNRIQAKLDSWFDFSSLYSHVEHEDMRCYVLTDPYKVKEEEYLKRFHGCPYQVGIDISVLDSIEENADVDSARKSMVEGIIKTAMQVESKPPYEDSIIKIVEEWKNVAAIHVNLETNLRRELLREADVLAGLYRGESKKLRLSSDLQIGKNTEYPSEWFADVVELPFGNTTISVPSGYQEMLDM